MFRPRGDLCWLQRPLFPLAVGVRPQRQPRGVQPAVPPDLRPDRRPGTYLYCRETPVVGARPEPFGAYRRVARRGRHFVQNRRAAQGCRLYKEHCGLLPSRGRRGAGRKAASAAGFSRGEHPGFHARYGQELHARGVGIFLRGQAAGRGVVRYAEGGGRVCGPCGAGRKEQVPSRSGRFARRGRRHLFPHRPGVRRHQCQRRRRRLCDAQPHGRYCARDGGLPQLRPPFQPAPRPQPYAPRDPRLGAGRSDGRGCQVQLYRL